MFRFTFEQAGAGMKNLTLALLSLVALAACTAENPADDGTHAQATIAAATGTEKGHGIGWFEGTVEEAFAVAATSGKPVFLYWGAEWCPPCHAINATIFNKPEFIERSKLFVPVYLDGDEANAQAYGEKFWVLGYPTMIVFDAAGQELTRIPGGIDIQAYASILDTTLTASSSARSLLAGVLESGATLTGADCSMLAFHSWGQDVEILAEKDAAASFRSMYEACPEHLAVERSILYVNWLGAQMSAAAKQGAEAALDPDRRKEAIAVLRSILSDPQLVRANIYAVVTGGASHVRFLTDAGSDERIALMRQFDERLNAIAADENIYKRERIYTLTGKMRFERIEDEEAEISAGLKQEIRDMVAWADASTPSVYERQPIINALGNVLNEAGMDEVARPLLIAELEKSKQPYYFMVDLADLEQRAGNTDAAIEWLKKAYDSTKGPATRFQWGYYYLTGLIEMTPESTEVIHETTVNLVTELLQRSGGIYQRPKRQLRRLEEYLEEWGAERGSVLSGIRESVRGVCGTLSEPDVTCETFLENA
jgi:thiol-disulfide isomerase/thioredoxin